MVVPMMNEVVTAAINRPSVPRQRLLHQVHDRHREVAERVSQIERHEVPHILQVLYVYGIIQAKA